MKRKENTERNERLKKYFSYGLAIGVGTAAFVSNKDNLMKSSRYISRIKKTAKSISKDINITGANKLDYKNISRIYKNNIKNTNSVWKNSKKEAESIKLRLSSNKSIFSSLKTMDKNILGRKRAEKEFADNLVGHIMSKLNFKKDDTTYFETQKLVNHVLNNRSSYFEKNKMDERILEPLIPKFKKVTKGTKLYNNVENIANDMSKLFLQEDEFIQKSIAEYENNGIFKKQNDIFFKNIIEKFHKKNFKNNEGLVTVNELIKAAENNTVDIENRFVRTAPGKRSKKNTLDLIEMLKENVGKNSDFGNVIVDYQNLRKTEKGDIFSIADSIGTVHNAREEFADTILGHLFWRRSKLEMEKAPNFFYFGVGDFDPKLANALGGIGEDIRNSVLTDHVYKLGDKFYKESLDNITGEINLKYIENSENFRLTSGEFGPMYNMLKKMYSISPELERKGNITKFFDIGGTNNKFNELTSRFTKFENDDWTRNVFQRVIDNKYNEYYIKNFGEDLSKNEIDALLSKDMEVIKNQLSESAYKNYKKEYIRKVYDDMNIINRHFEDFANTPDNHALTQLQRITSGESYDILNTIINSEDIIKDSFEYAGENAKFVYNDNLISLLKKYNSEIQNIDSVIHVGKTSGKDKNILNYEDMLKRELFKEAMLKQMANYSDGVDGVDLKGYSKVLNNIEGLDISNNEFEKAKLITNWAFFQNIGELYHRKNYTGSNFSNKEYVFENMSEILLNPTKEFESSSNLLKNSLDSFSKDISGVFDKDLSELDPLARGQNKKWLIIEKGINPLDIIKESNDEIMEKAIKQLKAGRNDLDNLTTTSFLPYHFVNRLASVWESIGLGFSNENTGDVWSLTKAMALKRLLPAALIMKGLSYANYESENLTGTSFSEAWYDGKANIDLGIEKTKDLFNLNDKGKISRQYNDIAKYWFGEESLNYEEKLDYYENGYDPIRKGRFWNFGSSSEFRGGEIVYFSPNRLRQAHSNYRDISIYGSSKEKWKHSLLPTPRHPLSTLRYLSNPYWLEKKNYEDRPYPMSGTMFDENSVWGVFLNPTIGRIIKPQKKMHQEHLQGTLTDVRSIIEEKNNEIIAKARERSLIEINEEGYTPIVDAPLSSPTGHEDIVNFQISHGQATAINSKNSNFQDYENIEDDTVENLIPSSTISKSAVQGIRNKQENEYFYKNKLKNKFLYLTEGIDHKSSNMSLSILSELNRNIINKSKQTGISGTKITDKNIIKDPIRNHEEDLENDFNNVENISKQEYVNNLLYSANQISGMYGFLAGEILPRTKGAKFEQAGNIDSFSRHFWDDNIGGLGSSFMEIARRFFPHSNHDITQINPIRNTMPEWMPGRFLVGDPYTKVLKGEARLPGPGFETLNKLHSDKYGRYGSFDRYKILADIAPYSNEYKLWKDIAKKEIQDPSLKKEMENIDKRVQKQIQKHDFFDYKFIGQHMATSQEVISEVSDDGKFKVIGSNEQYKIAGIKPLKGEEGSYIHKYIKEGMQVNLMFDKNTYQQRDKEGNKIAVVSKDGMNINREMFLNKEAVEKKNKDTLTDQYYGFSNSNIMIGHIIEGVSHMPLSFVHNKYLKVDSALESYKKDYIYGTPFSSWSHPIKTFLNPSFRNAFSNSPLWQMAGISSWALFEYVNYKVSSKPLRSASGALFALTNPGGFAGGLIGTLPKMRLSETSKVGARIGAAIGLAGYGIASANNPILAAANFSALGGVIAKQLNHPKYSTGKGALIGAGAGLLVSALRNPDGDWLSGGNKYIPKKTKERWDIEEYYDRLSYMKYANLYSKASRKAKKEEGVDIKNVISKIEKQKIKNKKEIEKLENLKNNVEKDPNNITKENLLKEINARLKALETPDEIYYGGKYTRAAVAYKKAMDTTIYGLSEFSNKFDVLRALPQHSKDYFMNFSKEKDLKKRKKILSFLSPYEQRAMYLMWQKEDEDFKVTDKNKDVKVMSKKFNAKGLDKLKNRIKNNREYFKKRKLPGLSWFGWQPNIDLENVKIKTIQNEGMLLSDFGIYESAVNKESYKEAPEIENYKTDSSSLDVTKNMIGLLNGHGFSDVDIAVNPTNEKGLKIISNFTRVTKYNFTNAISNLL